MPFTRPSFTEGVRERSEWATDAETGGWGRPRSLYSPSPGAPWAVSSLVHPSLVTIRPVGAPKGRRNRRWRMNEGPRGGSNGGMEMVMIGLCLSAHASRLRPFIKNISIPFSLRLTAFDWYLHPWVPFVVRPLLVTSSLLTPVLAASLFALRSSFTRRSREWRTEWGTLRDRRWRTTVKRAERTNDVSNDRPKRERNRDASHPFGVSGSLRSSPLHCRPFGPSLATLLPASGRPLRGDECSEEGY